MNNDDLFEAFFGPRNPRKGEDVMPVSPMDELRKRRKEEEMISKKEARETVKEPALAVRSDRFPKDGGRPIKASVPGYSKIPWTKGTLTLIAQSPDGQLHYAKTVAEKKQFAWSNFDWILVCWPGQYSQDIFIIDNMEAFRIALGFKKRVEPTVLVDEAGEEWEDAATVSPAVPIKTRLSPSYTYDDYLDQRF